MAEGRIPIWRATSEIGICDMRASYRTFRTLMSMRNVGRRLRTSANSLALKLTLSPRLKSDQTDCSNQEGQDEESTIDSGGLRFKQHLRVRPNTHNTEPDGSAASGCA